MDRAEFVQKIKAFYEECTTIVEKKNTDYAQNESPFKNFFLAQELGIADAKTAILVRMTDKLARLSNVLGGRARTAESVKETCSDLSNYAAILSTLVEAEEAVPSVPCPPDESLDGQEHPPLSSDTEDSEVQI